MSRIFLSGVQIAVSIWEIWLCYKLLYITVFDEKNGSRRDQVIMWCVIFLVGGALGMNRLNSFFSNSLFFLVDIIVIVFVCTGKRKKLPAAGIIVLYFVIVAIMDMASALVALEFLGDSFLNRIYIDAMTWQKECIFLLSRGIVCGVMLLLKKLAENMYEVVEQCKYTILGVGCILCVILIKYQFILDGMISGHRKEKGIGASFTLLALTFVVILTEVFVVRYQHMKQEKEALILREQLLEKRYMDMLENRREIHDMKNHLLLIQKYEKERRWKELHEYLEEIGGDILDDSAQIWSGNPIVDLILNSKKAYTRSRGINMEINTEIITYFPLNNREMISLFGNLLDNAIEACEKVRTSKKWIGVRLKKHHEFLLIEIENTIEEIPKERNGCLVSDKENQGAHGYGLKNVQRIIDKYGATYSYQINGTYFYTSVAFYDNVE